MISKKTDWTIFATRLQSLLTKHGLKQNQLSADTDISPAAINNYLSGRRIPKADILFTLANYFKVTPQWLSGEEPLNSGDGVGFSTRLRVAMTEKKLTQVAVAKEVGVTQAAVGNWKRGAMPKADKMRKLADCLDVKLAWLFGAEDNNQRSPEVASKPTANLSNQLALLPEAGLRVLAGWLAHEATRDTAIHSSLERFFNCDGIRNAGFLVLVHRTEESALHTALRTLGELSAQVSA